MQDLLFVGVGRMGRPYVEAAHRMGLRPRAIEFGTRADAAAEVVDEVHTARGGLDELVAEAAFAATTDRTPAGVVAFSEEHVMGAALLHEAFDLPGPSLHASVLSRNKALQRGCFAAARLPQPDYLVTDDLRAAETWAGPRLPVVVKPLTSSGSKGVELVPDLEAYRELCARRGEEGRLLVEAAVSGPEFSWEALVVDGAVRYSNVTAKETTGPPHFVEVAHRTAADLVAGTAAQVERLAAGVVAALRFRTGLVHLEFRITDSGPAIMEVAVRTPGDFIMDILTLTYGFDWFEMTVRLAMGQTLPELPCRPQAFAASYFPVARPGRVSGVAGLDEVRAHPCVVQADVKVGEGDVIPPLRSSAGRVGSVVLVAPTRAEREAALGFVRRTLRIDTE
jgi:biotin carboxylase